MNCLHRLDADSIDLVLVEGFKHVAFPRIELHRKVLGKSLLYPQDPGIIAVASDHLDDCGDLPALDINDTAAIAAYIITWLDTDHTLRLERIQ